MSNIEDIVDSLENKISKVLHKLELLKQANLKLNEELEVSKQISSSQKMKISAWEEKYEALKMATSENARLLELSGPRNPYRDGSLGVVKAGAYADLILVDGNPLKDLDLVADPAKNFLVIMKDGKVYKNQL